MMSELKRKCFDDEPPQAGANYYLCDEADDCINMLIDEKDTAILMYKEHSLNRIAELEAERDNYKTKAELCDRAYNYVKNLSMNPVNAELEERNAELEGLLATVSEASQNWEIGFNRLSARAIELEELLRDADLSLAVDNYDDRMIVSGKIHKALEGSDE